MYDVVVIGGGCAGLSAAIYASRAGKSVAVLEAATIGGQITQAHRVENYPGIDSISGIELADKLFDQAVKYGAEINLEEVIRVVDHDTYKEIITDENVYEGKTVVAATGSSHKELGLEREQELVGHGVSYCAVCDGAFYKNQVVAVNGGGNTALSDAIFLSQYCRTVYIIHRRSEFRAEKKLVDIAAAKDNIAFIMDSQIEGLVGDEELNALIVKNNVTGKCAELTINGLFIAIGQKPSNSIFAENGIVCENGYIEADENGKTKVSGVFAAGDCRDKKVRQVITAASDGASCALSACEYLNCNY